MAQHPNPIHPQAQAQAQALSHAHAHAQAASHASAAAHHQQQYQTAAAWSHHPNQHPGAPPPPHMAYDEMSGAMPGSASEAHGVAAAAAAALGLPLSALSGGAHGAFTGGAPGGFQVRRRRDTLAGDARRRRAAKRAKCANLPPNPVAIDVHFHSREKTEDAPLPCAPPSVQKERIHLHSPESMQ
jgi:hypothetical protein